MRSILLLVASIITLPLSVSALETRCFTEYTSISASGSSPFFITTEKRDDLFFTQNSHIIPSRMQSSITRETYPYTLTSSIASFPLERSGLLLDDITETQIEIDPLMAPSGFSLLLDFHTVLGKNTFVPIWDIISNTSYSVEISNDGTTYVQVGGSDIANYTFQYIRLSFPKGKTVQSSTLLRTLRFDKLTPNTYLIFPHDASKIEVYRGWICESSRLFSLENERNSSGGDDILPSEVHNPVALTFSPLPTTGIDSDGDTIIDMRDNCSSRSNRDQVDRNYDGIGDACSDDDQDGIIGDLDNCPTVSNTDQKDLNNNTIGDACEFDSDSDTIADGADNCRQNANPDQHDADSDGIGNACDNCRIFNPDQRDFDMNTIGDACTIQEEYEKVHDSDTDGVLDFSDNCSKTANQDQRDTDSDGVGDACDNCLSIQNTDQGDTNKNGVGEMCEDSDGDTVIGWRDNCIDRANPDQKDANNNGTGNACEDTDGDTIVDALDNCPGVWNQDQRDTDSDHIGNLCDAKDDRMIESNRTLFMVIFGIISLLFIAGIIYFMRKITF